MTPSWWWAWARWGWPPLCLPMGANKLIGVDVLEERLELTQKLGLADHVVKAGAGRGIEVDRHAVDQLPGN
jgi:threonine dehydrogenase-like Zn-dependent dehydrogenase